MYREAALEVFYPNAYFNFFNDDLGAAFTFLRTVVPRESLARLRRLKFTMTVAQCEGWAGGDLTRSGSGPRSRMVSGKPKNLDHKANWRGLLAFLATHVDLPRLHLTVDMAECSWAFIEDLVCEGDTRAIRFIYDFCVDVVTSMCALKTVGGVKLEMCAFRALAPWLEREVLGCGNGEVSAPLHRVRCTAHDIPDWHDMDERLEGSNHHPTVCRS